MPKKLGKRKYNEFEENRSQASIASSNLAMETISEEMYDVEEIVDQKKVKGKTFYLVKWLGYPSDQNTWEPVENLSNIRDMILEWEQRNKVFIENPPKKKLIFKETNEITNINDYIESYKEFGLDPIVKNCHKKKNLTSQRTDDKSTDDFKNLSTDTNLSEDKKENKLDKSQITLSNLIENLVDKPEPLKKGLKGNIEFDLPKSIKYAQITDEKLFFMCKWEQRTNGLEPFDSLVSHEIIKTKYPYVLIEFYESRLRCVKLKKQQVIEEGHINRII
jgi:hypothetical protein